MYCRYEPEADREKSEKWALKQVQTYVENNRGKDEVTKEDILHKINELAKRYGLRIPLTSPG